MDFRSLPKAELHCHLNGAVPSEVLASLLLKYELAPPELRNPELLRARLTYSKPCASLGEYLEAWSLLRRLPANRECFRAMVDAAIRAQSEAGVRYVELRHSIVTLAQLNQLSYEQALGWICEELREAGSRWGVEARLIVPFLRDKFDSWNYDELVEAIARMNDPTIVGLDSAGDEAHPAPLRAAEFLRSSQVRLGLKLTIHAGETGIVEHIRWAIDECGADRIGHGLAAAKDADLMAELRERDIPIEICPTSNWLTGGIRSLAAHPVDTFLSHGVPVVLCTDNPGLHGVDLAEEYTRFATSEQRRQVIAGMYAQQGRYAFDRIGNISA